jgi:hypothetical protein
MTGQVPNGNSNIIPIPKINKAQKTLDYRPISTTSAIAKLAESCIHEEIKGFTNLKKSRTRNTDSRINDLLI